MAISLGTFLVQSKGFWRGLHMERDFIVRERGKQ